MRLSLVMVLGLILAACGGTTATPVASQTQVSGGSASTTVNGIRANAGVAAIRRNATLDAVAKAHANDMSSRNFFSHTGSNGSSVGQRVTAKGYRWCYVAENISKGYRSEAGAIESWRVSPGHYRNLTNGLAREFGLAETNSYYVMVLAAKRC